MSADGTSSNDGVPSGSTASEGQIDPTAEDPASSAAEGLRKPKIKARRPPGPQINPDLSGKLRKQGTVTIKATFKSQAVSAKLRL